MRKGFRIIAAAGVVGLSVVLIASALGVPQSGPTQQGLLSWDEPAVVPETTVFVPNGVVAFAAESVDEVLAREALHPTMVPCFNRPEPESPPLYKPPTAIDSTTGGGEQGGGGSPLDETLGISFDGPAICGCEPPDPIIAAGTSHVLMGINDQLRAANKTNGATVWSTSLDAFWSAVRPSGASFTSDPDVWFDPDSQRYFATMIWVNSSVTQGWWSLAVSQSDQINNSTVWYKWTINSTAGGLPDFPHVGVDHDAVYITSNTFPGPRVSLAVIPKAQLLTGTPSPTYSQINNITTSSGSFAFTLKPVQMYGANGCFFVSCVAGTGSAMYFYRISNPLGTPSLIKTSTSVPAYSVPPDAAQPGTSNLIATNDDRMLGAAFRNNHIWCSHAINVGNRAAARWYEFDVTNYPTVTTIMSGTVTDSTNHYYYPSINVDSADGAALGFTSSNSSSRYPSAYHCSRLASDPAGTMSTPTLDKAATVNYGGSRWGDYSGTAMDVDGLTFWSFQEYSKGGSNGWGTWTASFMVTTAGDHTPPLPNPMTFSTPPNPVSPTAIAMTATLAVDANSPPVQYYFHFVNGGPGGADSGWQSARDYTNSGLTSNTGYYYQVKARDSAVPPNETQFSAMASTITLANVPAAPALTNPTANSLNLVVSGVGNPAATELAIQCSSSADPAWNGNYVSAIGTPVASAVWQSASTWGTLLLPGLLANTQYCFAAKARNGNQIETAFSTPGCGQTLGAFPRGDMNCDGAVNFGDINPFVLALSDPAGYAAQYPNCNIMNGDINGDGVVDFGDINPFVALLGG